MPSPLLLIPVAGVGLYYLLRKPAGFVAQPVATPPLSSTPPATPAQQAANAVAPPGSPQAAVDQAVVNAAFQQQQQAQGQPQDTFTPGSPNAPPPISVVDTQPDPTALAASLANVAADPFGALGSLLNASAPAGGGGGGQAPVQDTNLSFDPGSGLNKDRPDLSGTTTSPASVLDDPAGFLDSLNPFGN